MRAVPPVKRWLSAPQLRLAIGQVLCNLQPMIAATQSNHPLATITTPTDTRSVLEVACASLRQAGMRVTKPRIALLNELIRRQKPASIEEIHDSVKKSGCDLVTVYRCLSAFERLGLVHRSFRHNGTGLYHIAMGSTPRYHVVCKRCGSFEPVEYFPAEGVERMLASRGYTEVSHVLEFFGVCPQCSVREARAGIGAPAERQMQPGPAKTE